MEDRASSITQNETALALHHAARYAFSRYNRFVFASAANRTTAVTTAMSKAGPGIPLFPVTPRKLGSQRNRTKQMAASNAISMHSSIDRQIDLKNTATNVVSVQRYWKKMLVADSATHQANQNSAARYEPVDFNLSIGNGGNKWASPVTMTGVGNCTRLMRSTELHRPGGTMGGLPLPRVSSRGH